MALLKDTDIALIKQHLPVRGDFDINLILPFASDVEQEVIIPVIGQELYDQLNFDYNNGGLSVPHAAVLVEIQKAMAPLLLLYGKDVVAVKISNNGMTITTDEHTKTAFEWQIVRVERTLNRLGWNRVEHLLAYMETNKVSLPLWTGSSAYPLSRECFINSATEYTKYNAKLEGSRQLFNRLKPTMLEVEETEVQAVVGAELYHELKEAVLNNSLTAAHQALMPSIKRAVAHLTLAAALPEMQVAIDGNHLMLRYLSDRDNIRSSEVATTEAISPLIQHQEAKGRQYLAQLKAYLDMNADDYANYTVDDTEIGDFDNEEDSPIFMI